LWFVGSLNLYICGNGTICADGITADISELSAPSGPRSFTLSVMSDVLVGVNEEIVTVSRKSEQLNKEEFIVVTTLF
jgi:hypothetical protein